MRIFTFAKVFYIITVISLCAGCIQPAAPPELAGSPEVRGLLLLDAKIKVINANRKTTAHLNGATISRLFGRTEKEIKGKKASGMIIFSDLRPGVYRLKEIEAILVESDYITERRYSIPNVIKETTFKVKPKQATYMGKLTITKDAKAQENSITLQANTDPKHEVGAWYEIMDRYKGSPWHDLMQERVDKLMKGEY